MKKLCKETNHCLKFTCAFFILIVAAKLNKIMEAYDVFVSVKPKPKQPSKASVVTQIFMHFKILESLFNHPMNIIAPLELLTFLVFFIV